MTRSLLRYLFCFLVVALSNNPLEAQFDDPKWFLLDSVDYDNLEATDRALLDSSLTKYHNTEDDTVKLKALGALADGLYDGVLWPRYNRLLYDQTMEFTGTDLDRVTWFRILSFRSNAINNFGYLAYNKGQVDEALAYYKRSSIIQRSIGYLLGYAHSLNNIGAAYKTLGQLDSSLHYYNTSYELEMQIRDTVAAIQAINNIGELYKTYGDLRTSQAYYLRGLKLAELCRDQHKQAETYAYLGELFKTQKNFMRAKSFYDKALAMQQQIGSSEGVAHGHNNLGSLYLIMGDSLDKALSHFTQALQDYKQLDYFRGMSGVYSNISTIHFKQGDLNSALDYSTKSMSLKRRMKDPEGLCMEYASRAQIHLALNSIDSASFYANKAKQLAAGADQLRMKRDAAKAMYEVYLAKKLYREALMEHQEYFRYRDQLAAEEDKVALIEEQYQYEWEQKAYADSVAADNIKLLHEQEISQHKMDLERQRVNNLLLWIFSGGAIVVALGVLIALRNIRKSNQKISAKHQELTVQKALVEEKNTQIIDSINYAKRIQTALLKSEDEGTERFPHRFVFYQPKDIVSGDFYWVHETENYLYVCVADCTGHGVPGAFMSMLGIAFLQEIVSWSENLEPHEILNKLRAKLISELSQKGDIGEPKDGMDASLLRYEFATRKMQWCGANNGIFVVSESDRSIGLGESAYRQVQVEETAKLLTEILPQRQPVGYDKRAEPFRTTEVQLSKGDKLYLYSDGFSDQFGGALGKKYGLKNFKKFLLRTADLELTEQREKVREEFVAWKGDLEQLDDICVVGITI